MYSKSILTLGLFGLSLGMGQLSAQNVFTVGKQAVSKTEFLNWYQKNNAQKPSFDKASLENFVNLYALYKMKVMDAQALKIDTLPAIQSDIEMYKSQLTKSFGNDKKITDALLAKAYEHSVKERSVAHIMLTGFGAEMENANKSLLDSLAMAINSGKISFEAAAKEYSLDRGTAPNGGALGYIHAFQTPYEFEEEVYATPVGKISKTFKTKSGYHLVKVLAERPALGTVEVAQILLPLDEDNKVQQMTLAQSIVQKLKSGNASFEQMVKEYSEDIYSKNNKGVIKPISSGSTEEDIEKAVFGLKNRGDISEPVKSTMGIHIFKLIKDIPVGTFEQEKEELSAKINRYWSKEINDLKLEATKKELNFKEYPQALTELIKTIDNQDFEKEKTLGNYPNLKAVMMEVNGKKYHQQDFLSYIKKLTQGRLAGNKEATLKDLYRVFSEKMVSEAHIANLEKTNPEYKKLSEEYTNGVLIFDLMEKNIWNKASQDSLGLEEYYKKNSNKYQWEAGFKGEVLQSQNHDALLQIKKAIDSGKSTEDALKEVHTPENDQKIYQQTGRFNFSLFPQVAQDKFVANKVIGILTDNQGNEYIIIPEEVYQNPQPKSFIDAKDKVVEDYQKVIEKNWNDKLKAKYPLKINTAVLNSLTK